MARKSSHLAAIALVATLFAVPAFADVVVNAQQEQQPGAAPAPATTQDVRVFDALVVTGATQSGDTKRWASDAKADVPEISDADWVPTAPRD